MYKLCYILQIESVQRSFFDGPVWQGRDENIVYPNTTLDNLFYCCWLISPHFMTQLFHHLKSEKSHNRQRRLQSVFGITSDENELYQTSSGNDFFIILFLEFRKRLHIFIRTF